MGALAAIGRLIDAPIGVVAPGWAAARARARLVLQVRRVQQQFLSTYAAADKKRTSADWTSKTLSADQAGIGDAVTMTNRARTAARDHWAADSIGRAYRRHVVGIGITPRAAARDPDTGKELTEFNQAADRLWYAWARRPAWCDVEGRKSLTEIQGLIVEELVNAGEAFVLPVYARAGDHVGLAVQLIEPEQLDLSKTRDAATGNEIRGGVEITPQGRPVAYHVYTAAHPLEKWSIKSTRISAERIHHVFRQRRVRQTRGVTALASVLVKLRHAQMYDEYMLVRARLEACIGLIVTQDLGIGELDLSLKGPSGDTGQDANANEEINFEPGMVHRLRPGENVAFQNPTTPGGEYSPFTRAQYGQIAAGVGLDYATVSRDFSQGNYSSQRQGLIETWGETDPIQALLRDTVLTPIRDEFVTLAIVEGRLDAPGFLSDPAWADAYLACDWQPPPKPWIDPARQAAAIKIALEQRLTTRRAELNRLGEDVREVLRQTADEQALADELGVRLPEAGGDARAAPVEPRPTKAPPGEPEEK